MATNAEKIETCDVGSNAVALSERAAGGDGAAVAVAQPVGEMASIYSMIERAARDPNTDIDKMERLLLMKERMEAVRAKTEFLEAFSALQAELPHAARRGTGHNNKKYARFEDVIVALRDPLTRHGFSLSHRVDTSGNVIRVTGILGHRGGHTEQTEMTLPPDTSGGKTPVHAMASAISYGKRYVTLTLTGIATDDDDDGKAAGEVPVAQHTLAALTKAINETKDPKAATQFICQKFSVEELGDLTKQQIGQVMAGLAARKRTEQVKA